MRKRFHLTGWTMCTVALLAGCGSSTSSTTPVAGSSGAPAGTGGTVSSTCAVGLSPCGAACVDLLTNSANCGSCNNVCRTGQICQAGICQCTTGLTACDTGCFDLTSDPAHCGSCTTVCTSAKVCSLGTCSDSCAAGLIPCGSSCVDINVSLSHCGGCDRPCASGQSCQQGACSCPNAGETLCSGVCVNTQTSSAHCGGCDISCSTGQACSAGSCTGGTTQNTGGAGDGTAGSAGTAGSIPDEPTLITSGRDNYWQVGEVTEGGSNPSVTIDTSQTHQEWHGFGGTFNEQGWEALLALSASDRERAIRLLFDVQDGIGFTWGRIPIGPSDYAVNRYTLSSAPGQFDISRDEQYLIPYIQAAQKIKGDIKFWASPWTPPPWAKSGSTENDGYDKGYFNTQFYEEYAQFFVDWIQAYQARGISIDHVHPQNEPGWSQSYPTCAFGPARDTVASRNVYTDQPVTLGTFVDGYLFPSISAAGLSTDVWYGVFSNNAFFDNYWQAMRNLPSASKIVGVSLQWATRERVGTVANAGYIVMQSEHQCGNYPWLAARANSPDDADRHSFLAHMAPNNHAYGEESWDLIKSWIDDGVNIYSAWNMVLDHEGFNLDEVRRWPQNALLAVNKSSKTLQITAAYYVFRHAAQYVEPGARRLGVQGGDALAFLNPDGSVVTILYNSSSSASPTTLSVGGTALQFTIPANGWATVNWQSR